MPELLKTPLFDVHQQLGGRIVDFAGWQLPVMYQGIVEEHLAVRKNAGLFDTSHMGRLVVSGKKAAEFLQHLTVNDIQLTSEEHCQYNLFCLPTGGVIDDLIACRRGQDFYLVVNAGNRLPVLEWFQQNLLKNVEIKDETAQTAMLSLQGPLAKQIMGQILDFDFTPWKRNMAKTFKWKNIELMVSYTGYTGETGLETILPTEGAILLWQAIREIGQPLGLLPCGLGARDTLRLEAALPLYGHELTREITPFEAGLGWAVKLSKGDFFGRDALFKQKEGHLTRRLIGLALRQRAIPRAGYEVRQNGQKIGWVTSGNWAPFLDRPIAMAMCQAPLEPGQDLEVVIRDQPVPATVVPLPFYKKPQ